MVPVWWIAAALAAPGTGDLGAPATPLGPGAPDVLDRWTADHRAPDAFPAPVAAYTPVGIALAALADHARRAPDRVAVEAIGTTVLGEPIWAFHIADPTVPVVRTVLVFAGIHALEWISTETAVQLAHDLITAPPPGVRVTVIPVLNVDGRLRSERDVAAGDNVYRRGNAGRPPVDLNRDFAVNHEATSVWRHVLPGYHASSPAPLSQPETRALDALAARERYDRAASLHAFGGYLYTPWTGRWRRPEAWPAFVAIGRSMEAAQGPHAYRTRQLSRWGFFFRANGSEIDHLYGRYGTLGYLIELTRSGFDLAHPADSLRRYVRWYDPEEPRPHVERGVAALQALIRADDDR
ncbi:MAG: M14 family metallopeptidase [Myxococcota bacterium]